MAQCSVPIHGPIFLLRSLPQAVVTIGIGVMGLILTLG